MKTQLINYTERELKILELLKAQRKPITTLEISKQFYGRNMPFNSRQRILHALRYLNNKLRVNRAEIQIASSKRNGPHSINFWIEKKRA